MKNAVSVSRAADGAVCKRLVDFSKRIDGSGNGFFVFRGFSGCSGCKRSVIPEIAETTTKGLIGSARMIFGYPDESLVACQAASAEFHDFRLAFSFTRPGGTETRSGGPVPPQDAGPGRPADRVVNQQKKIEPCVFLGGSGPQSPPFPLPAPAFRLERSRYRLGPVFLVRTMIGCSRGRRQPEPLGNRPELRQRLRGFFRIGRVFQFDGQAQQVSLPHRNAAAAGVDLQKGAGR